jgi:Phytanoyl-CoA dioxygenase (PhyH)
MTATLTKASPDDETLADFQRNGFVSIKHLVSAAEVARIKAILLRLYESNTGFKEGAQFDAAGPDGDLKARRFPQILSPRIYAPELTSGEFYKAALRLAKSILGDKARLKNDFSFMKPPRIGSDTPWHQDEAFGNPNFDHQEITIWLALTPANPSNSCMSFIPRSHLSPVLLHRPWGGDPRVHALECLDNFDLSTAVMCPLLPGGATIHDCRTLHYAGPNPSDDYRLAYALQFDVPPKLRAVPQEFPWVKQQQTDRAARNQKWRRHGGIFLFVWRERRRMAARLLVEIQRRAAVVSSFF